MLKRRTGNAHNFVLEAITRSGGYTNYDNALKQPSAMHLSLGAWTQRLRSELEHRQIYL